MNFVNLVHKILTESKPVILPSKVNILIDEIFNWVKSLCDPELWNQNKVSFSSAPSEFNRDLLSKDFYFSNYVYTSHFLHNYKLECRANVRRCDAQGSCGYVKFENIIVIDITESSNGLELAELKRVIRHEIMHAFDPARFNTYKGKTATSDRTKLKDGDEPVNDYNSYINYLTKPTPYGGKIPAEFTPRLDTLLQYFSVEKWRGFLNDINNTDSEHINKCIYRLVNVTTFAEIKKHSLYGDLTALYHYLKDPYIKRKTLQKIFWFVNNHTTQ